jgi:site-specific recombinase XerD
MDSKRIFRDVATKVSSRALSKQTQSSYTSCLKMFCIYFDKKEHPIHISTKEIEEYIGWVRDHRSIGLARQSYWAIRFLYVEIEKQPHKMDGIRPIRFKHKVKIPLETDFILKTIQNIKEPRAKAIIALLFSTGLRKQECAKIKVSDIDPVNKIIHVRGKGDKERIVPFPENLRLILREYLKSLPSIPKLWLFEGEKEGHYISPDTVYRVCQTYLKAQTHVVRHSYATALRNAGVDLLDIKELLGHSSLKTTEIYLHNNLEHIKTLKNPIDKYKEVA